MTPDEFRGLVSGVKEILVNPVKREEILNSDFAKRSLVGEGKVLQEGEAAFRPLFRKSLMAGQDIPAGTALTKEMLYAMRPQQYAGGLPSEKYEEVLGKKTKVALKKFDPIILEVLS